MKSVLMIAFHFPPIQGSSGIQRTLGFARHLPEFGWQPIVLTAHPRAYPSTTDDLVDTLPPDLHVIRAQAWDASRHFAIRGRYSWQEGAQIAFNRWLTPRYQQTWKAMTADARPRAEVPA